MNKVLDVENVTKKYGKKTILSNLTASFYKGEFVGLVGISGSGKTTFLKCLLGLTEYEGKITSHNRNIRNQLLDYRKRVGYCCQGNSFYKELTVKENLKYFGDFYNKKDRMDMSWLIDFLDLRHSSNIPAKKLSGGMKRRLDLGCALIGNPEILFLDEPFSGLDPLRRTNICSLLRYINNMGKTIILSTHDLGVIKDLCSRIIVIKSGSFKEDLPAAQLIKKYSFVFEVDISIKGFNESDYEDFAQSLTDEEYEMLGSVTSPQGLRIYVKEYKTLLSILSNRIAEDRLVLNRFFIREPEFSEVFKILFLDELQEMTTVVSPGKTAIDKSEVREMLVGNDPGVVFQCLSAAGVDPMFIANVIKEREKW